MQSSSAVVIFIPLKHLVLAKAHETHSSRNETDASLRMIAWWHGVTHGFQHFVSNCLVVTVIGTCLAWEKQSIRGQKHTIGNGSTWSGVRFRTKATS